MKLSLFIIDHMAQILDKWDEYAATMTPAAGVMTRAALRDHAEAMLGAVAVDIDCPQSARQQLSKSLGGDDDEDAATAASEHGHMRQASNFTLLQLSSEFRALRASVLRLWLQKVEVLTPGVLDDVIRFNEAIDQALAESIVTFSARADHSRNLFDAILGHDLRGPLSSITLAGELLTHRQMPEAKVMELGATIKRSARFMAGMVDDMLEFARTKLGGTGIPVEPAPADMAALCTHAIADASAMHPRCRFELETSGRLDASVDANRMHQLLVNLLGNAGQHGADACPIHLHLSGDERQTVLQVSNAGPAIAPEFLKVIFEPMVRLSAGLDEDTRSTTSLGLGLHIAREIALAHGGTITCESGNERTTFTVTLPRAAHG